MLFIKTPLEEKTVIIGPGESQPLFLTPPWVCPYLYITFSFLTNFQSITTHQFTVEAFVSISFSFNFVSLSVCLSVYLSVCLSKSLYCLSFNLMLCLCACLFLTVSVRLSVCLTVFLFNSTTREHLVSLKMQQTDPQAIP